MPLVLRQLGWKQQQRNAVEMCACIHVHMKIGAEKVMYCRGIRGAITVDHNDREEILVATTELLKLMVHENNVRIEDIASISFTLTDDLDAVFPALAARQIGWNEVPLICMREIPVPNSLEKCIRVLLLVNTTRSALEMQHIYMRKAISLRPEFVSETG